MNERLPISEPLRPRITASRYIPNETKWQKARSEVIHLASIAKDEKIIDPQNLEDWCKNIFLVPNTANTTVVLNEGERIVGFSTAIQSPNMLGLSDKTADISTVVINPQYQQRGYVSILMDEMEEQLRKEEYRMMQGMFRVDNGFADATIRHYGDRVLMKAVPKSYQFLVISL